MWRKELNLKEQNYEIELDIDEIQPFEERILFSGICDFTVPMTFSNIGNKKVVTYDCCNYIAVGDMDLSEGKLLLEILEKTFVTLGKSLEFYIPPENITLTVDTVFYNPKKKQVKIAYIPNYGNSLVKNIRSFIYQLYDMCGEESREYLEDVIDEIEKYNLSIKHMASYVHQQRRIMNQCFTSEGDRK